MPYPCPIGIRGCHTLLTGLGGSLCHLVVLLVLCRQMYLFLLREVIVNSGVSFGDVTAPRARSIHGIAASYAFFRNCSLSNVFEGTSWRSNAVFTSSYLNGVHCIFEGVRSLGLWLQQANVSVIVLSTCPLYPRDETAKHR